MNAKRRVAAKIKNASSLSLTGFPFKGKPRGGIRSITLALLVPVGMTAGEICSIPVGMTAGEICSIPVGMTAGKVFSIPVGMTAGG